MKNSFISQLIEKVKNSPCLKDMCFLNTNAPSACSVNMPFFRLAFAPFSMVVDNIKNFFIIAAFYSAVFTIISVLIGFPFICGLAAVQDVHVYCSKSFVAFGIYNVLKILVLAAFFVTWYRIVIKKDALNLKSFLRFDKIDAKVFLTLILFLIISSVPLLSFYLLYVRVPNPDWRVEIAYFGVVSLGFFVPFIAMRFYSIFAFVADGQQIPPLKVIWEKTAGSQLKIILALFFVFILIVFSVFGFYSNYRNIVMEHPLYVSIVSDFLSNLVFYLVVAIMVNHTQVQKEILFEGNENEQQTCN